MERIVFTAAMALIGLWVADDAFVNREPGTAVGDHLAGGLVPIALLAASAVAYPRLRAGWRAALALAWAPCAIAAGVADGVRHVAIDRFAGDDGTAILAGVAGVALLVLGAWTLWRHRRDDERPLRRWLRRAGVVAAAAFVGVFVVMPVCFAIVTTHPARAPVSSADLGRPYEEVTLTTSDGLELDGWYVPSRNRAAVIVFPGRRGTLDHARLLVRRGYGVLLLDRRGEGTSEGDGNARGWSGEPDLVAALDLLSARDDVDPQRIGGLGLSVGGELLLQTAAHDRRLAAVVSEGAGIRSLAEQMHNPDAPVALRWLSPTTVETAATAVLANASPPPSLTSLVGRIAPRAVLLIRAEDGNVDEGLNEVYFERAGEPKALWALPSGGHTGALRADPGEYERRVVGFLDTALLGDR
ncbi:MAG TPA: CocE/NonD family hydrolase [Capillimicrobium sp.]|nr:CocE/NonD family hydrolase [Capillimicrobium sp.]